MVEGMGVGLRPRDNEKGDCGLSEEDLRVWAVGSRVESLG